MLYRVDNHENQNKQDTNGDNKVSEDDGVVVDDESVLPKLEAEQAEYNGDYASSNSIEDIGSIFLFAAENTNVEWSFKSFESNSNKTYVVSTSHENDMVAQVTNLPHFNELNISWNLHSHPGPNGTKGASYAGGVIRGDWDNVQNFYKRWTKAGKDPYKFPTHGVYHKESKTIYYYTPWNKSIKGPTIKQN